MAEGDQVGTEKSGRAGSLKARLNEYIVSAPGRVLLVFLVATAFFALGLPQVSTEAGTSEFAEDLPSQNALETIDQQFNEPFAEETGTTQLIQRGENVLSKRALLRMLTIEERLQQRPRLRVSNSVSAAGLLAQTIDPTARTPAEQRRAIEQATPSEIDVAVRERAGPHSPLNRILSKDFNPTAASASATVSVVTHRLETDLESGAGQSGSSPLTDIQIGTIRVADSVGGDIRVFGSGIIAEEFSQIIVDSLLIVVPASVIVILTFLIIAYRDPFDFALGILSLAIMIIWTFGFMGWMEIPFSQMLIAAPPLLLAVGIDFGIHTINRYREERQAGRNVAEAMRRNTSQLLVAFGIVAVTSSIGFLANLSSALAPVREFGLVAAVGIVFTFLIFGIFLPAAKVYLDRIRQRYPIPTISERPLGSADSTLGAVLKGGVVIADKAPVAFLFLILVLTASSGVYATGISTTFSTENFLPPEETAPYLEDLPEPFKPSEYTVTGTIHFLEETFESGETDQIQILYERPMRSGSALEAIHQNGRDPPDSFVSQNRQADGTHVLTLIESKASRDPAFRKLVARNDEDGNGIPDNNLERIYDELEADPAISLQSYLTEDRRQAKLVYQVEAEATDGEVASDANRFTNRFRYTAIATGQIVVFQAVADLILESALTSLILALLLTAVFLIFIYWYLEGEASLGLVNLVPIVVTVGLLAGSMRLTGLAFNAFTATVLAITIGLGIDYSVHLTHRFVDEFDGETTVIEALVPTVTGTGGALFGSMVTTAFGIGVLVFSVFPAIGQFGILTGLSVIYAFLTSIFVLPAALVVWARSVGH